MTEEWKPIEELFPINEDISGYGYSEEYIEKNKLDTEKSFYCSSGITGRVSFHENIEIKKDGENILFRENDSYECTDIPEQFETQYGIFTNHNHGEFVSWLEKNENDELEKLGSFFIDGNYCDMFDCGRYSYAISNLMHAGLGIFKIVRISSNLQHEVLYDTLDFDKWTRLEYFGRFENDRGFVLVASGFMKAETWENDEDEFLDKTILFQICSDGGFSIVKEWNIQISSSISMVKKDDFLYFGQNKMVTRLNLSTGELLFYTNKSVEELDDLKPLWQKY